MLQSCCRFPSLVHQVGLEAQDFGDASRRTFFAALGETRCFNSDGSAKPFEVATRAGLDREWISREMGAASFPLREQALEYARELRSLALGERFASAVRGMLTVRGGLDLVEATGALVRETLALGAGGSTVVDAQTLALQYLDEAEKRLASARPHRGLSTGLARLDRATRGLCSGELTTIVAAGGVGKTTLVENWRLNLARAGVYSIAFSGEMSEDQIGERAAHAEAMTPLSQDLNFEAIARTRASIANSDVLRRMLVDPSTVIEPEKVRSIVRAKQLEHGNIGLVAIDHVRHLKVRVSHSAGDTETVAVAALEAKAIAKDLATHVILLCHVNREGEKVMGANGDPDPSLILGGPRILNASDNVLCLWRPEEVSTLYVWKARQTGLRVKIPLWYDAMAQTFSEIP